MTGVDTIRDQISWYVRCLKDVQDGRVVRGLSEAKAGYDAALDSLAAAAESRDLRPVVRIRADRSRPCRGCVPWDQE